MCGSSRPAVCVSHDADDWFSRYLSGEREVRAYLVRSTIGSNSSSGNSGGNSISSNSSNDIGISGSGGGSSSFGDVRDRQSFSNNAPFLLLTLDSVKALIGMIAQSRLQGGSGNGSDGTTTEAGAKTSVVDDVKVENFRPNLVVSRGPDPDSGDRGEIQPHQEDGWSSVRLSVRPWRLPLPDASTAPSSSDSNGTCGSSGSSSGSKGCSRSGVVDLVVDGPCARCSMVSHTHEHICIPIHTYIDTHMNLTLSDIHTHTLTHTHTHIFIHSHTHTHTLTPKHTHSLSHTLTHSYSGQREWGDGSPRR